MEQPRQRIFTNKQLLALVIPIFMEQMLGILVGLVDSLMVSSVGEVAISGVFPGGQCKHSSAESGQFFGCRWRHRCQSAPGRPLHAGAPARHGPFAHHDDGSGCDRDGGVPDL